MRMIRYYGMEQDAAEYQEAERRQRNEPQGRNIPVTPLPNPGEGGPVYEGPATEQSKPEVTIPPSNTIQIPVIPLPNPGEGGPAFQNPSWKPLPSLSPRIEVRFVNAANGYDAFTIYLDNRVFVRNLSFKETTEYENVSKGEKMVSLVGPDGYIYYQAPYRFSGCRNITILILNTGSNLELLELPEHNCK